MSRGVRSGLTGDYVVQSVITNAPGREEDRDRVVNKIRTRVQERECKGAEAGH